MSIQQCIAALADLGRTLSGIQSSFEVVPADISGHYPCLVHIPASGTVEPMTMSDGQRYRHEYDVHVHLFVLPVTDMPTGDEQARPFLDAYIDLIRMHPHLGLGHAVHAWVRQWTYSAEMLHGDQRYWGARFIVHVLEVVE